MNMDERRAHNEVEEERPAISRPPQSSQPYPWLVILDDNDESHQTFYSISENRYYVRSIPELQNKFIVSSQQGWLFLEDNSMDDWSLFNMFTLEKLQLPPVGTAALPYNSILSSCTKTKIDDNCRILHIQGSTFNFLSCHLGDSEFVSRHLNPADGHICAVLNYEGKLYAMSYDNYDLFVADFADEELHFTPVLRGYKFLSRMLILSDDMKHYLIESGGEILCVYTNHIASDSLDIKIYKADLEKKEWVLVECLGDRALFLDYYKGLSSSSTKVSEFGLRGNCVYYVSWYARNLYVYDLGTGRITTSLPYPIVTNDNASLYWAM